MENLWSRVKIIVSAVACWVFIAAGIGCFELPAASAQEKGARKIKRPAVSREVRFGTVTVTYDNPRKKKYKRVAKVLKRSGAFDRLAKQLTQTYKWPSDLRIRFTELSEENASYDDETHEIEVGYELVYAYSEIFEFDEDDPEAFESEVIDAAYFTVFHEIGHAVIDFFKIPFTGSEEDAADEFATLALLKIDDQRSLTALLSGIEQFSVDAEDYEDISELDFSDEHSFDKQRFYALLSLVYGSDPELHSDLVDEEYLSEERAESSVAEYQRKAAIWDKLLAPHLRN